MGKRIASTAMTVLIINVLSRALALFASSMITATFGVNSQTGAFSFALTLTNIITTVIGTTLTTSVIPIYTDLKENHSPERSGAFINNTISLTVIVSFILIALGAVLAPLISALSKEGDYNFSIYAIRVLLFSIVFICLYYVFSGVLQANNRFHLVAMVSLPSSLASIIYIFTLSPSYGMYGLPPATVIGFFLQAAILVPALKGVGYRFKPSFHYKNEDMFKIFKVAAPVIIGVCAYQVNMLTNSSIAFSYDASHFVVLNNAQNLGIQIIMTLVLAIAAVIYPKMSYLAAKSDMEGLAGQLSGALSGIILLLLPISFGFFIFSKEIMDIVYGYGKFSADDVVRGGQIFSLYAFSVLGIGFKEIADRAFYSLKNTKTSAYNGVLIMTVNIALSVILVRFFGLPGIAAAYSAASVLGGLNILIRFKLKHKELSLRPLAVTFLKSLIACGVMALVIYFMNYLPFHNDKQGVIFRVGLSTLTGAVAYGIILIALKTKELKNILINKERS